MNDTKKISKYLDLIEFDAEETVVCTIRKHPVGLISIYFTGFLIAMSTIIASVFLGDFMADSISESSNEMISKVLYILAGVLGVIIILLTHIAAYVYQHNIIIVTSDKVVQILYRNIIDRKISQLSLGDLQDVTVDQRGILARAFGYGTLVIETAGEQNNFTFTYAPHPYVCAKDIVGSRESSIKKYGN
jgi:uncharacterized membrane protein YdbT with pleckstrin-like domain